MTAATEADLLYCIYQSKQRDMIAFKLSQPRLNGNYQILPLTSDSFPPPALRWCSLNELRQDILYPLVREFPSLQLKHKNTDLSQARKELSAGSFGG